MTIPVIYQILTTDTALSTLCILHHLPNFEIIEYNVCPFVQDPI